MNQAPAEWRIIGASVQGTAHARKSLPNQDALRWFPEFGRSECLLLCAADGHGDGRSFRSSLGSAFAVQAAQTAFQPFIASYQEMPAEELKCYSSRIKYEAENTLPFRINQTWRALVEAHWQASPPVQAEIERLTTRLGAEKANSLTLPHGFFTVYGTTLLAALATPHYLIYIQLGDGDILAVSPSGYPYRIFDPDERLIANETTSLCQDDAIQNMRVRFQFLDPAEEAPALILLSTDGFKNSFESQADYQSFGTDLFQRLEGGTREEEIRNAGTALTDWLMEITRAGSGDDVSLGVMIRSDAFTAAGNPTGNQP